MAFRQTSYQTVLFSFPEPQQFKPKFQIDSLILESLDPNLHKSMYASENYQGSKALTV